MTKLQLWIPGSILALGCLVNSALVGRKVTPKQLREPIATVAPVALGIKGYDTLFAKATVTAVGMTEYINRIYSDPTVLDKDTGKPRPDFGLYVGYYDEQRQGKTIHSPKNCLPGGGPSRTHEPKKDQIKRLDKVILDGPEFASALYEGKTLDQLNVQAGDEIIVAEKKTGNIFTSALSILGAIGAAASGYYFISQIF